MYQTKPVIKKLSLDTKKTYIRRLFGRLFLLKRMIRRRRTVIIPQYEEKIKEIELQIQKLHKEREKWLIKTVDTKKEIRNILTEHNEYLNHIVGLSDNPDYETSFHGFHLKEVIKKDKGGSPTYKYYEGRVIGRVEKDKSGKDRYFSLGSGNPKKVVRLIQRELGIVLDETEKSRKVVLENYLLKVLRKRWLESISSVE